MNKKLLLIFLVGIFLCGLVVAEQQSLGTFKQNDCITLKQICSNCTYNNISSVNYPDGSQALGQVAMSGTGTEYTYNFCITDQIGQYVVNGYGDLDGVNTVWTYTLNINANGMQSSIMFYIVILLILGGLIGLGFSIKDGWFTILGGMGLIILGIYSVTNGLIGVRDTLITWAISIIMIGSGAYLAINSALEMMQDEK